jgi:hypothetical protein
MNRRSFFNLTCGVSGLLTAERYLAAADKYTGPRPKKKDVLYLVHADNLIETEAVTANQSNEKDSQIFSVPGAASPVRTPLAEPIFLLASDRISPDSLGLFRFDVRNGQREIVLTGKKRKSSTKQYHLSVRNLDQGLSRIEASEPLDVGEYSVSPEGSNTAFCFSVY